MVTIPRHVSLAIAAAYVRREDPDNFDATISRSQSQHAKAFGLCIAQADYFIRTYCGLSEVATVVAEDVPKIKASLREIAHQLKSQPFVIDDPDRYKAIGYPPLPASYQISRVKDTVHFVEKRDGPFIQIADACAFAIRRYVAGHATGDEFVNAMVGPAKVGTDTFNAWKDPQFTFGSCLLFNSEPLNVPTYDLVDFNYHAPGMPGEG
jgi:hypothetical protein